MTTILCPTRGGEASQPNQDWAIALAQERGARLLFLYVTDVNFLLGLASPVLVDMEAELDGMGEFVLAMACERASKAGVEADSVVRHGVFSEALESVAREFHVDTLVLGSPAEETALTSMAYVRQLAQSFSTEVGVETYIVDQGEVVAHYEVGEGAG